MKMKLKKIGEHYWLVHGIFFIACTDEEKVFGDLKYKLHLQQIETLLGKVDPYKLGREKYKTPFGVDGYLTSIYIEGYNQCLKDNSEKKFTFEDVIEMVKIYEANNVSIEDVLRNHLKEKTEWEVEVETESWSEGENLNEIPKITDGYINIKKII
jgi:hypothetical protein